MNPAEAKFCASCGHKLGDTAQAAQPQREEANGVTPSPTRRYALDFGSWATMPTQIKKHFLAYAAQQISDDGESRRLPVYMQLFEESGFRAQHFEEEAIQLTASAEQLFSEQPADAAALVDDLLQRAFLRLLLEFFVKYASVLTPARLSPKILRHTQATSRADAIADYLQLSEEGQLTAYSQILQIPPKKLQNAQKTFFAPQNATERPLLFIDLTLWGSGSDGVVLTQEAIYWKHAFHQPARVAYDKIYALHRNDKYLEINQIYFSISPTFNYKLLKLLQYLRRSE